ncbi:MAG: hypothetical protein LBC82_09010 [Oscillospiraceae bacterium]|nr:hypothetical protein [Oscillospiraceae bacterium]
MKEKELSKLLNNPEYGIDMTETAEHRWFSVSEGVDSLEGVVLFKGATAQRRIYDIDSACTVFDVISHKVVNISKAIKEFRVRIDEYLTVFHPHLKKTIFTYHDVATLLANDYIHELFIDSGDYIQIFTKSHENENKTLTFENIKSIMFEINARFAKIAAERHEEFDKILKMGTQVEIDNFADEIHMSVFDESSLSSCKLGFIYDHINKNELENFLRRRGYI